LRGDNLPRKRGNRAHLLVSKAEQNLRTGRGFGVTTTAAELTAAAIKRIACGAKITPIRIDGNGVPLAVGRTRRTVTPAQWPTPLLRDHGCIFPGCDRPAYWCEAHHRIPREEGGPTDLNNLLLLRLSRESRASHSVKWAGETLGHGHERAGREPGPDDVAAAVCTGMAA
jgi:hypothetical protein